MRLIVKNNSYFLLTLPIPKLHYLEELFWLFKRLFLLVLTSIFWSNIPIMLILDLDMNLALLYNNYHLETLAQTLSHLYCPNINPSQLLPKSMYSVYIIMTMCTLVSAEPCGTLWTHFFPCIAFKFSRS